MKNNSFVELPEALAGFFMFKPKMRDGRPRLLSFVNNDGKIPVRIIGVRKVNGNRYWRFHPSEDPAVVDEALKEFFTGIDSTNACAKLLFG